MTQKQTPDYTRVEWAEMFPEGNYWSWNSSVYVKGGFISHNYVHLSSESPNKERLRSSLENLEQYGRYCLHRNGGLGDVTHLERDHFKDPINPTKEELTLFELEFGFKYMLIKRAVV